MNEKSVNNLLKEYKKEWESGNPLSPIELKELFKKHNIG